MYNWGINMDGVASRDPAEDVMAVSVPVEALPEELEQFTISVEDAKVPTLVFTWDKTRVSVCLLYTSPSPRDRTRSRMPSSA